MYIYIKDGELIAYSKNKQLISGEEYNVSNEDLIKLQNGCSYENGEIVETEKYLDKIKNKELLELKEEYANIIYSEYSKEKQATYQMWATKYLAKVIKGGTLTDEEQIRADLASDMEEFITGKVEEYKVKKDLIINN